MNEHTSYSKTDPCEESRRLFKFADQSKFRALVPILLLLLVSRMCIGSAVSGATAAWGYGDFWCYYHAADRLQHHEVLYPPPFGGFYVYPPLLAELLRPLAKHSIEQGFHEWAIICAGCLALAALISAACNDLSRNSFLIAASAMMLLGFRFWPTTMNFAAGQANVPLVLCIAAMTWAACRRWHYLAALFVVAFILVKTWGIGLFLYFVLTRQWKALFFGVAALVVSFVLLFTNLLPGEFARFISTTRTMSVQPDLISQSILGFARVHFRGVPYVEPLIRSTFIYYSFAIFCFAILLAGIWQVYRNSNFAELAHQRLLICFTVNTLMLVSPLCHSEYSVLYIPSMWALLCFAPKNNFGVAIWLASAATYFCFFTIAWPGGALSTDHFSKWKTLTLSMNFFGGVLLWLLCIAALSLQPSRISEVRISSEKQQVGKQTVSAVA